MAATPSKQTPLLSAFISHAKADAKKAQAIAEGLEKRGLKCWIAPRDVRAGRAYGDEIIRGIESARAFVLVLSEASNDSVFVAREVERAVSKRKPVLAIRIADVEPAPSLELFVSSTQWIDAFKGRLGSHIDRLAERLADEEGIDPAPETGSAPPRRPVAWKIAAAGALPVLALVGLGLAFWPAPESRHGALPLSDAKLASGTALPEDGRTQVQLEANQWTVPQDPDFQSCDSGWGETAVSACDRAIYAGKFSGRDLAYLYNARGYLYMAAGDFDRSRADFDRSIELDPAIYHPYWNRAEILRQKGDVEAARADYEKALSLGPKEVDKRRIEASLISLASLQPDEDPTVITTPTWEDPGGGVSASAPVDAYQAASPPAAEMPASPPALDAAPGSSYGPAVEPMR